MKTEMMHPLVARALKRMMAKGGMVDSTEEEAKEAAVDEENDFESEDPYELHSDRVEQQKNYGEGREVEDDMDDEEFAEGGMVNDKKAKIKAILARFK